MGALKNMSDQEQTSSPKDKTPGYVGSIFGSIGVATLLSVLAVRYPTAMAWICGLLVLGGIGQVIKKDQSKQKRFQTLMIAAASGFALIIAIAASKTKPVPQSQPTSALQSIASEPSTTGGQDTLKPEDIDHAKLTEVKKEMADMMPISDEERNRQIQVLKEFKPKAELTPPASKPEQFFNKLRMQGIGLEIVVKVQADEDFTNTVKIVVADGWHSQPYQTRLQAAQNLQKLWGNTYSPTTPDRGRIELVDLSNNKVGGTGATGLWVQEK